MKEYKLNELFQWEDRTLMCVEHNSMFCNGCHFNKKDCNITVCCGTVREDCKSVYFTNKLIFSAEGLTLQIKRKGYKVKVKVLELSEEFSRLENNRVYIVLSENKMSSVLPNGLSIYGIEDKCKCIFPTEQEAIDWVEALFSLRGE